MPKCVCDRTNGIGVQHEADIVFYLVQLELDIAFH